MKKVVFIDRDGVINKDSPDYIKSWKEFEFLPGSINAIKLLTEAGFHQIIITNQSAVNRKFISRKILEEMHRKMVTAITSEGGKITDIFYCPHTPEDHCDCRKPKPGLIARAIHTHKINLVDSIMIGDSAKDVQCGMLAGCNKTILVRTGNGTIAERELLEKHIIPDYIANDLLQAAHWIISHD